MTDHGFWAFSVDVYKRPGVEAAALNLQDEQGFDVNLVLWCLWLGSEGRIAGKVLQTALTIVDQWNEAVTHKVRPLRRSIQGVAGAETVYRKLLDAELECERLIQTRLDALLGDTQVANGSPRDLAIRNLQEYARQTDKVGRFDCFLSGVFQSGEIV